MSILNIIIIPILTPPKRPRVKPNCGFLKQLEEFFLTLESKKGEKKEEEKEEKEEEEHKEKEKKEEEKEEKDEKEEKKE